MTINWRSYGTSVALGVATLAIPLLVVADPWPQGTAFSTWATLIVAGAVLAPNGYVYLLAVVGSLVYGITGIGPTAPVTPFFPPIALSIAALLTLCGRTLVWRRGRG